MIDQNILYSECPSGAYIAGMKSGMIFFEQTGDKERAQNTQDAIELIQNQFGRK